MRKRVRPTPLKKCVQVFDKEDRVHIHRTTKNLSSVILQSVTQLLPKHIIWLSTTFEEVSNNWLEVLHKLRRPDDNMEVGKNKTQKASQSFPRYDGIICLNEWANSPVMRGLYCDSRDFLVLTLSHFVDLTRIPLTSSTNHIFSLRWTTVLGEVRIWR